MLREKINLLLKHKNSFVKKTLESLIIFAVDNQSTVTPIIRQWDICYLIFLQSLIT